MKAVNKSRADAHAKSVNKEEMDDFRVCVTKLENFRRTRIMSHDSMNAEPRWEKESIIENARSVKLIVEVVSTNWRDDYFKKRADYEEMGISEYWIVDNDIVRAALTAASPGKI